MSKRAIEAMIGGVVIFASVLIFFSVFHFGMSFKQGEIYLSACIRTCKLNKSERYFNDTTMCVCKSGQTYKAHLERLFQ